MDYMQKATKEAFRGMRAKDGGPFGAVIVKKGKILASAHNMVLKTHDPTAHAEITVIRKATKKLKRFDLSDCEIYSSCEPCPMCLAAIEWARIKKLYYGCTREDAHNIGFSDKIIYEELKNFPNTKRLTSVQICDKELIKPFEEWSKKKDKKMY
jgi:guanine deaminase